MYLIIKRLCLSRGQADFGGKRDRKKFILLCSATHKFVFNEGLKFKMSKVWADPKINLTDLKLVI